MAESDRCRPQMSSPRIQTGEESRRDNGSFQTSVVFADKRVILANTMKLVTVDVEGKPRPGRIADDHIIDLSGIAPDLRSILESGGLDRARSAEGSKIPLKDARLLAPIQNPALLLSVGMNYDEH